MTTALFKFVIGAFLFGVGIIIGLLEIIALIDPVGTKMADDSDPFGDPHIPWYIHGIYIFVTLSCFYFGYLLMRNIDKKR